MVVPVTTFSLRLPNGYGSVYKLGGKRRRPYTAVITERWTDDGRSVRKYLGYYVTKKEALEALATYNARPYKIDGHGITLAGLFEKWKEYRKKYNKSMPRTYLAAYKRMKPLYNKPFVDIKSLDIQELIDNCPLAPSARIIKVVFNLLYKYAALLDLTHVNMAQVLELPTIEKSTMHKPFTKKEIDILWKWEKRDFSARFALLLCYTGMRANELLKMKTKNVFINERYMVGGNKTEAGKNREIPISKRILPIIKEIYSPDNEYLLSGDKNTFFTYSKVVYAWKSSECPALKNHLPHDGRHTCESALDDLNTNKRIIQLIIGHAGKDVDERVYTHKTRAQLIEAIDRIFL